MENKYLDKSHEITEKFNSLPQSEREKILEHQLSCQLLTIEQLKTGLKRGYNKQIRDLTFLEDNILRRMNDK